MILDVLSFTCMSASTPSNFNLMNVSWQVICSVMFDHKMQDSIRPTCVCISNHGFGTVLKNSVNIQVVRNGYGI